MNNCSANRSLNVATPLQFFSKKLFVCALLTLFPVFPIIAATTHNLPEAPSPEQGTGYVNVENAVHELLELLREKHLLKNDSELRQRILKAIIDAADCNGKLLPSGSLLGSHEEKKAVAEAKLLDDSFYYLKLAEVNPALDDELVSLLEKVQNDYTGIIIDLRKSDGHTDEAVTNSAEMLTATGLTIIVLIDHFTVGPAEVLAERLKSQGNAVLVGEPTRGYPFPLSVAYLQSGESIYLPNVDVDENDGHWQPSPLQPDVQVEVNSSKNNKDLVLSKAVDLLKTIQALGQRHF